MHAGPPDVQYTTDLVEQLRQLLARVDATERAQATRGKVLVGALTDQFAAGQAESLYGLQTAATTVRQRAEELERLAEQIPEEIGARVRESVEALAGAASDQISAAVETASTRLGMVLENIDQELGAQQKEYLAVLRKSAEDTGAQLSAELEEAAAAVLESAGRAQASQTAVRAGAVAAVEALKASAAAIAEQFAELQDHTAEMVDQATEAIAAASEAFVQEAEGLIQGITSVGDSFIGRMFEVLDERDAHEAALEARLTDRLGRITIEIEQRLAASTAAMAAQIERLETRDLTERTAVAAELHDLVRRLLSEPRGRLKDLRNATQFAGQPVRSTAPAPLRQEPSYDRALDAFVPEPPPRQAPAPRPRTVATKAPAKRAPAKKAPAKRAPAKKAPAKKGTSRA